MALALTPQPAWADEATEAPDDQAVATATETVATSDDQNSSAAPEAVEALPSSEPAVTSEEPAEPPAQDTAADEQAGSETTSNETGEGEVAADDQTDAADENEASEPFDDEVTEEEAEDALSQQSQTPATPAAPAGATDQAVEDGKTYVIQAYVTSNRVLDAAGASPKAGANVSSWTYGGGNNQKWIAQRVGDSLWYRLLSAANPNLALGVSGTNVCVINNPADDSADLLKVLWAFVATSADHYRMVNATAPSKALDINGNAKKNVKKGANASLYATNAKNPNNQSFRPIEVQAVAAGTDGLEGAYTVTLASNAGLAADVSGASRSNGANVGIWTSTGAKHQQVYLAPDGNGYYVAWVVGTGKVLDVAGASIFPGTNILQYAYGGRDNQKWAVVATKNEDGSYTATLQNKATGLMLGATSAAKGANIAGLTSKAANITFTLTPQQLITAGINVITPLTTTATALDISGASTGTAKLLLWTNSGALNQRFELQQAGDDLWRIRTASSGGWITWTGGSNVYQRGTSEGDTMSNGAWTFTDASLWRATWTTSGAMGGLSLINVASGKAFDMNGGKTTKNTQIIAWSPNGRDSQHYLFTPADLFKEGVYFVTSGYTGRRLNVAGGGTTPGSNVITWTYNTKKATTGGTNEKFRFSKVATDDGYAYKIVGAQSGLPVTGGGFESKNGLANVSLQRDLGGSDQLWYVRIGDGGWLDIVNVASGQHLTSRNEVGSEKLRDDGVWSGYTYQSIFGDYNVVERANPKDSDGKWLSGCRWKLAATSATVATSSYEGAGTNILMIGNSFTYYMFEGYGNAMPNQAKATFGDNVYVTHATAGGKSLADHLDASKSLGKNTAKQLLLGRWDYVVLQEHSTLAIDNYASYLESLKTLKAMAQEAGAKPVIYGTWAFRGTTSGTHANGALYRAMEATGKKAADLTVEEIQTQLDKMHKELQDAFVRAAKQTDMSVIDAGTPFTEPEVYANKTDALFTTANRTTLSSSGAYDRALYNVGLDDKHPSSLGSKLIAYVICDTLKNLAA